MNYPPNRTTETLHAWAHRLRATFLGTLIERATRGIDLSPGSLGKNLGTLAAWALLLAALVGLVVVGAVATGAS